MGTNINKDGNIFSSKAEIIMDGPMDKVSRCLVVVTIKIIFLLLQKIVMCDTDCTIILQLGAVVGFLKKQMKKEWGGGAVILLARHLE